LPLKSQLLDLEKDRWRNRSSLGWQGSVRIKYNQ
jgi:hypothetical protein